MAREQFPAYSVSPNQERLEGLPGATWGTFTRYLEIGSDRYVTRQVDWFENGYALRYDREHYVDEFGMLGNLRYTGRWKRWWPQSESIEAGAFERIWADAAATAAASLQVLSTERASWPAKPPWLR
jgi:hypothetical protein